MIPCPDCGQVTMRKYDTSMCHIVDGYYGRLFSVFCDCGYKKMVRIESHQLNENTIWEAISEAIRDK